MFIWIDHVVFGWIREVMRAARANYGVDPVAFLIIYLATVPVFYYSIFRMVKSLARRRGNEIMIWSTVFLAATAAPFLYVLFFGRNLPWWVYVVIGLLIGQGVFSLIRRLAKNRTSRNDAPAGLSNPPDEGRSIAGRSVTGTMSSARATRRFRDDERQ